jgi:tetratricopeptide (TPR) repeat protein
MKYSAKFAALLLTSVIGMSSVSSDAFAYAQDNSERKTYTLSERVGKKVAKIYDLYAADQIDEAITLALEIKPKKPYDKAYMAKFLGSMYAGQKGKGLEAIKYLQASVDADILSTNEHGNAIRTLADLQVQEKLFKDAIKNYRLWMDFTGKEDPKVYIRIGVAYMELKEYNNVVAPADKAIELQKAKPDDAPYRLKLGAYYESQQPKKAIGVLEIMVGLFPAEAKYWAQLGQFYMLDEQYEKALETMHIAYINGYLTTKSQILVLAQLYTNNMIPYRAAVVLEKHMKSGLIPRDERMLKLIAASWHQAKETKRAIKYYGEAAAIENNGELYYKQGTLSFELEKHKDAIKALKLALEDKKLRKPDNAMFTLAQAYFYNGQYKTAHRTMKSMERAKTKSVAKNAKIWVKYIEDTAKRRKVKI